MSISVEYFILAKWRSYLSLILKNYILFKILRKYCESNNTWTKYIKKRLKHNIFNECCLIFKKLQTALPELIWWEYVLIIKLILNHLLFLVKSILSTSYRIWNRAIDHKPNTPLWKDIGPRCLIYLEYNEFSYSIVLQDPIITIII